MSKKFARRELDRLYAELPTLDCQGKCVESCGPILMSRVEWQRIIETLGYEPVPIGDDLTCPMLVSGGRCGVYEIRPTICRLWGVVDAMPCTFGCEPSRPLTRIEGYEFLARAGDIGA